MRRLAPLLALALAAGACSDAPATDTVTVLAHDFFVVDETALAAFTAETGITVEILLGGDAGIMVNQALLTAGNPVADVLFGVDTTLLSRALDGDLFHPYVSPAAGLIPAELLADDRVTPIDFGDVCINFDRSAFTALPPPTSLADLTDPAYRGMLVVEDPTISSPGLAFFLATVAVFGESGPTTWRDYWADLRRNDVAVVSDWGTAYYGAFSGAGDGDRPLVVSYASSPGAELIGTGLARDDASTGIMTAGCFRQVEYAGVLRGTPNRRAAEQFIDFLLSTDVQAAVPETMFVHPVRPDVPVPAWIGAPLSDPVTMDPRRIESNRDRWLAEWTDIVLR